MFRIKEDLRITNCCVAHVNTKTLFSAGILNNQWVSLALHTENQSEPLASTSDRKPLSSNVEEILNSKRQPEEPPLVARHFELADQRKKDSVLQIQVQHSCQDIVLDFFQETESREKPYENDIVYVSPCAMFNIVNQDVELYQKSLRADFKVTLRLIEAFDEQTQSNYAKNLDVSPVSCTFGHLTEDAVSDVITGYFLTARVLQENQLFSITLDVRRSPSANAPCLLWFRVNSLEPTESSRSKLHTNACFVNDRFSNLYFSNPVQSHVPLCPCTFRNSIPLAEYYRNLNFLEAYKEEMLSINNSITILRRKAVKCSDIMTLIDGRRGVGKGMLVRSICQQNCFHYHEENCLDLVGDSLSATEKRLDYVFEQVKNTAPCALYLKNIHVLCKDKEGIQEERRILQYLTNKVMEIPKHLPVMLIGSTCASKEISVRFFSEFIYHVEINAPVEKQRLSLINSLLDQLTASDIDTTDFALIKSLDDPFTDCGIDGSDLAKKTAGFILSDLIGLFTHALNSHLAESDSTRKITRDCLESSLERIRTLKAGNSESVKIPKVTWDDVGGLQHVKDDILDTLELPLKFPHLFSNGLQRSGLLFYGPPGCGKTLLAKAIATEFSLNFYSVKGPELINMYVGQSEENVREVFKKARSMAPCIIFFDEIDSLAPNRGKSGDSGGVMDRIVSQLLAELDGMHDNTDLFVVAATNRPDLLDPSLLRPGRFDKLLYIGIPEQREERLKILTAVTRKLKLDEQISLEDILDMCPANLTGADFSLLASNTMMSCFRRMIKLQEETQVKLNPEDAIVSREDFVSALNGLTPSVSLPELERYKTIKEEILNKR